MIVKVYRLVAALSGSVFYAQCVKDVHVDVLPANLDRFARDNGGHFCEVV